MFNVTFTILGGRRDDNEELATRTLRIQSKRYYVDVKQNNRGRFIKLVEVIHLAKRYNSLFITYHFHLLLQTTQPLTCLCIEHKLKQYHIKIKAINS